MKRRSLPLRFVLVIVAALLTGVVGATPHAPAAKPAQTVGATTAAHTVFLPLVAGGQGATQPPPPSIATDQDLIAAALAAGRISYHDSLVLRAFALLGDPRLPRAYWGSGSAEHDGSLFREIVLADSGFTAAQRVQLAPLLARPSEPESIFNQPRSPTVLTAADVCSSTGGWRNRRSADGKLMVWARCTGDYDADIDAVLTRMTALYGPMTAMMGPPREDSNSEGPAIDLYLVTKLVDPVRRNDQDFQLSSVAATIPIQVQGTKASGFILLDRERVGDPDFALDLAHEFFHVLQNAHNFAIGLGKTTDPATGQEQTVPFWWDEATAEWAAAHFVRERSASIHHPNFAGWFQRTDLPLHAVSPSKHPYAAYIWPLFIEQEERARGNSTGAGAPGERTIAAIWRALEPLEAGDVAGAMRVIDAAFPFRTHFHRFAMRNLNSSFDRDDPLPRRYVELDANFPDEQMPQPAQPTTTLMADAPLSIDVRLPSLRAHYYHFKVDTGVTQLRIDTRGLGPADDRRIGAVIKLRDGGWVLREDLYEGVTFCDTSEDVEQLWLVISHHNPEITRMLTGSVTLEPQSAECGCSPALQEQIGAVQEWSGTVSFSYNIAGANEQWDIRQQRTATVNARLNLRTQDGTAFLGSPTGQGAVDDKTFIKTPRGWEMVSSFSGSSAPVPYDAEGNNFSRVGLALDSESCTYHWNASVYINATFSDGDTAGPVQMDIGSLGSGWMPINGLVLAGSGSFPGHSPSFILTHDGPSYDQPDAWLLAILGEDNLGAANVTWRFEPVERVGR